VEVDEVDSAEEAIADLPDDVVDTLGVQTFLRGEGETKAFAVVILTTSVAGLLILCLSSGLVYSNLSFCFKPCDFELSLAKAFTGFGLSTLLGAFIGLVLLLPLF
jgi:hypothetical protein